MQQIIVYILHKLQSASQTSESNLKSELLVLLDSEALTNACWAELRASTGPNGASVVPLLPDRVDEVRRALDLPSHEPMHQEMREQLRKRAEAVRARLLDKWSRAEGGGRRRRRRRWRGGLLLGRYRDRDGYPLPWSRRIPMRLRMGMGCRHLQEGAATRAS